jgi:hypothetical protein
VRPDQRDPSEGNEVFEFSSLRRDWYASNSALPRAFRRHLRGAKNLVFKGFPRHWIPIFEWFGVPWADTVPPIEYVPFFSDLSEDELVSIVERARQERSLRILVESSSMYDSTISDFLYILDNTCPTASVAMQRDLDEISLETTRRGKHKTLKLNGWQAYGRPSVRAVEASVMQVEPRHDKAAILPCALTRPYHKSRTHKKIYRTLGENGFALAELHRIVITSLGVLPEEVWTMPQVLAYDAGVPDIYRILRLSRSYFAKNRYEVVVDCLQFEPYSDILRIIQREGLIERLTKIRIPAQKPFHLRP